MTDPRTIAEASRYPVVIRWSDEDFAYIAEAPDLPNCSAFDDSEAKALERLRRDAIPAWLEAMRAAGNPIPSPISAPSPPTEKPSLRRQAIERLRTAGPHYDGRMDEVVATALGWIRDEYGRWFAVGGWFDDGKLRRTSYAVSVPAFTRSIDAAERLVPPGWGWAITIVEGGARAECFQICGPDGSPSTRSAFFQAPTAALAFCMAALRAQEMADAE